MNRSAGVVNCSAGVVIGMLLSKLLVSVAQRRKAFRRASGLIITRLVRSTLMLRLPLRRPRDLVRLRARQRMSRRRHRLPYAVKHRPRLHSLRLRWRTSSSHCQRLHSPSYKRICADASAARKPVSTNTPPAPKRIHQKSTESFETFQFASSA